MKESELLQKVKQQLVQCHGYDGDEVAKSREQALDYYFQRPRGDEVAGRSQVVSGDLSAMVEANLAQMLDAFTTDNIIEFEPLGPEDEDQAQLEATTVQYFVMSRSNGFLEIAAAIKDALLVRNGIIKVYVEEREESRIKTLSNVAPEALVELINQPDVVSFKYDEETLSLTLRLKRVNSEFIVKAVPPENFLYFGEHDSPYLQDIPFCAERHIDRRSDLVALGFQKSKVDALKEYSVNYKVDAEARKPRGLNNTARGIDKSQDQVEWYECYALIDKDGDGISERRKICISGETLLSDEPVNLVPYASGTAIINPHRFMGISLFDKLKQVQDMRTGLRRALLDNVNTTTKNRLAYLDGKVNVDDVGDGRPNGAIRVKANVQDVRQAVMPFAVPDTSANILANLESTARERAEMGGAALDLQTAQMQIGGDRMGSQGLDRAYSVMEQLAAMMTKTIAVTLIRSTMLLAHATLREYYDEPVPVKKNGKWESPIPSEWQERRCVIVKPGMSPGERARKANSLKQVIDAQIILAEKGMDGVLVSLPGFNRALLDWARVSDIQNPEQYFVDPESESAQIAMQDKQKQAQEQTKLKQALMQQAVGLEQMRLAFEKYKADAELQFKYYDAVLDAEVEEAKIAGKATTELLKTKANGQKAISDRATAKPTADEDS